MPPTPAPIPLSEPHFSGREWEYVKDCLDTGWVSSVGAYVSRFEQRVAELAGQPHGVAIVNGTAALHLALQVAGVRPGDAVLVSDLTFIAPVNAIRHAGAEPILVDVDPATWQMDAARVAAFLAEATLPGPEGPIHRRTGRRIGALLPVDILGHPVDLDPLLALARPHGLPLVQDASESLGALYRGRPVGAQADLACFSFNGNKVVTTGGGGAIVTANPVWAKHAKHLSTQDKAEAMEFIHDEVGYNYRLTNLAAALGCAQLERIEAHLEAKRRIAARYDEAFAGIAGLHPHREAPWARSSHWLYTVQVDPAAFPVDRAALQRALADAGIQTRPLWQPIHLSPAYPGVEVLGGEVSEALYARCLSLPCSVGLSSEQQERVITAVTAVARGG